MRVQSGGLRYRQGEHASGWAQRTILLAPWALAGAVVSGSRIMTSHRYRRAPGPRRKRYAVRTPHDPRETIMEYLNRFGPLVGRILLATIFVLSGIGKVTGFDATVGYIAAKALPMPQILAIATIVVELGAGLMLIAGWKARAAAAALSVLYRARGLPLPPVLGRAPGGGSDAADPIPEEPRHHGRAALCHGVRKRAGLRE